MLGIVTETHAIRNELIQCKEDKEMAAERWEEIENGYVKKVNAGNTEMAILQSKIEEKDEQMSKVAKNVQSLKQDKASTGKVVIKLQGDLQEYKSKFENISMYVGVLERNNNSLNYAFEQLSLTSRMNNQANKTAASEIEEEKGSKVVPEKEKGVADTEGEKKTDGVPDKPVPESRKGNVSNGWGDDDGTEETGDVSLLQQQMKEHSVFGDSIKDMMKSDNAARGNNSTRTDSHQQKSVGHVMSQLRAEEKRNGDDEQETPGEETKEIYVGNIPNNTTERELEDLFGIFVEGKSLQITRKKLKNGKEIPLYAKFNTKTRDCEEVLEFNEVQMRDGQHLVVELSKGEFQHERKEVCKWYLNGNCKFGNRCNKTHPNECTYYTRFQRCRFGSKCKGAHFRKGREVNGQADIVTQLLKTLVPHLAPMLNTQRRER